VKDEQANIQAKFKANPIATGGIFVAIFIGMCSFNIPFEIPMVLISGALFGVELGALMASISSTIGCTVALLMIRTIFGDCVGRKYKTLSEKINQKMEEEGAFYLFSIRLVAIIPYFVVNIAMGLTNIKLWVFAVVSWIGMLPGIIIYANAGSQLGQLQSMSQLLEPRVIIAMILLGLTPLILRKLVKCIQKRIQKNKSKETLLDHSALRDSYPIQVTQQE